MHPTAWRLHALGNVSIDVLSHVGKEGDDVVVRHLLDLVDALNREICMFADPGGFFLRDAASTQFGLGLARQHLDFLPDLELVLHLPDGTHFRASVTANHDVSFLPGMLLFCRVNPSFGKARFYRFLNTARTWDT